MPDLPRNLPKIAQEWEDAMDEMELTGKIVHGAELASASRIEYKQFLLLRVLWVGHHATDLPKMLPGFNRWIAKAEKMLKGYKSWGTYCQSFTRPDAGEGNFSIARHYQLEVTNTKDDTDPLSLATPIAHRTRSRLLNRELAKDYLETPSKSTNISTVLNIEELRIHDPLDDSETLVLETPISEIPETPSPFQEVTPDSQEPDNVLYPPSKDEQIVNCALVIFLNALTIPFKLANNWTLHRKASKAIFDNASFEARTDGYLDDRRGEAHAIIEVKPVRRSMKSVPIQMQESAQMVAWIKNDCEKLPNPIDMRHFLVAQDRHEIYLIVAQYHADYVRYLTDSKHSSQRPSFMTMHMFGPWDTLELSHMKNLGPILLAITLRADAELRKIRSG
ncbi:uncharacterized protein BO87DRAFT_397993 [Aspergillus neoniger CBS 115656]|uniref:Uncharacterized protein n=1 Tax=Aspergillus neoniger (strain CBS 115656) TaxID=1448310 RepID=A0A318YH01_ASPNB|nr:hypothetical protein BO87DRAFT_397993 [Aspergillus neoniger CBS 115656]PYH32997.1 hypothetical protein BO87DRAFT_397993 [Aspergillus neoniger CBS 115656]